MDEEKGSGWLVFASVMLMIVGVLNVIWGITALAKEAYFEPKILFANLTLWGIIWLIIGIVEIAAGAAVLQKAQWARWFGVVMASLGLLWAFMGIGIFPVWSIVIIVIEILVIYGLVEYAIPEGEPEP